MGSITYNFLSDSILFNEKSISNNFRNETDSRIEKELLDYRNHCIKNYPELIKEIKDKESFLKVFSSTQKTPYELLKQTSLYVDQFIIYDPLFRHSDFQSDMSKVTGEYLGYQSNGLNKTDVSKASKFLKEITPMIVADYVKIFPLSYHFEGPKSIPLNLPTDYYNSALPKPIMDFFWDNVSVRSMKKMDKGGWYVDEDTLKPCRGIVVDFKESNFSKSMIYHLFEMEMMDFDENTGKATFKQTLPDTPPTKDHFNAWVQQSINSASKAYFDKVFNETFIASNLNSTYLCDNNFTNNLITENFETKQNIPAYTATQIMNLDLPFLENLDIQKLMDIRLYEENVFTNFRLELEKSFRELRNETDEKILKQKAENIFHELDEVQGQKIKNKIDHIKKQASVNAIVGLGGLASSFHTGGFSLLATAVAMGKGYTDYLSYNKEVKNNPAYLLWKSKKASR
ncbi:hypothetical protein GCM10009117_00190 [Gangjinia marincola]|uniref:Uncharacterized protein n=1 Tax=Gangjinia marincola TaxID=578463 RepID=A0ABP3XNP1_9FLAO